MSDICLRGDAPRSSSDHARSDRSTNTRAARWWPQFRNWLSPDLRIADDVMSEHLLADIGLSYADLAALRR